MWRVSLGVACAAVIACLAAGTGRAPASDAAETLRLTAAAAETGWISLAVRGPDRGAVVVRELTGAPGTTIARLTLRDGAAEQPRVVRWRCERRRRRFAATLRGSGARLAPATIVTPSCADRLRMIVVPAHVRPGRTATVRVTDTWRFGGVAAHACARLAAPATNCRRVRLPAGAVTRSARLRLVRPGRRTIVVRSEFGQRLAARVEVRRDARLRMLVTGDSMIFGLNETLAMDLGARGSVLGDAHPGRGITTPGGFLDWPAHARRKARVEDPDVTVLFLGSADAGYPLITPSGESAPCCEPAWVAVYAARASEMMAAFLRDGRGLVYWLLLPTPRSPAKARITNAENDAVRLAGRGFDDGVRVIERVADVIAPHGVYADAIRFGGRMEVVRESDGIHLAPPGVRIAADIVGRTLRGDGLLDPAAR
jgi:hypothetical protein